MDSEDEALTTISQGQQAKEVLDHPAFRQAIALVQQRIDQERKNSKEFDIEIRERLWLREQLLKDVVAQLEYAVTNGTLEQQKLKQSRHWLERLHHY